MYLKWSLFLFFSEEFLYNWYDFFLKCEVVFTSEAMWHGIFFVGRILTSNSPSQIDKKMQVWLFLNKRENQGRLDWKSLRLCVVLRTFGKADGEHSSQSHPTEESSILQEGTCPGITAMLGHGLEAGVGVVASWTGWLLPGKLCSHSVHLRGVFS